MSIALASRLLASFRRTPSGFAGAAVPDAIAAIPEERSPAAQLRR
jgi:hypothetical protein